MSDETSAVIAGSPGTPRYGLRQSRQQHWAGRARQHILLAALAALPAGCVYDESDRCSPGQELLEPGYCACLPGSVLAPQGCVACGENEVVAGSECACADGYSRPAAGGACVETPSGLGAACSGATCADPAFPVCATGSDGSGYCTKPCAAAEDCEGGYVCDTAATPAYCQRPPVGAGKACTGDADCAGGEATLCESFMLRQCVVRDCSPAAQDCFSGYRCCDFTSFGAPATMCLPSGAC